MSSSPYSTLPAFIKSPEILNVVIETPKASRNRYKFEPDLGLFVLDTIMPSGLVYPYDYGFIPSTLGEDGDPLDALVFLDQPSFCGCVIPARLIGVIEACQTEQDGRVVRNDRFLTVPSGSPDQDRLREAGDLSAGVIEAINRFFVIREQTRGKQFHPQGQDGPERAFQLIEAGIAAYQSAQKRLQPAGNK